VVWGVVENMAIHCHSQGRRTISAKGDDADVFDETGRIARSFWTFERTHVLSKPKWTSSSRGRSWLEQIGQPPKIGLRFSSRVYASSWLFAADQPLGRQQRDRSVERFAEPEHLVSAFPSENSSQIHSGCGQTTQQQMGRKLYPRS